MSEAPVERQTRKRRDWFVIVVVVVVILLVIAAVVAWALFGAVQHTPSQNAASANVRQTRIFTRADCRFPNALDNQNGVVLAPPCSRGAS